MRSKNYTNFSFSALATAFSGMMLHAVFDKYFYMIPYCMIAKKYFSAIRGMGKPSVSKCRISFFRSES